MEPSLTAEATRLTLLERTSPTAKTPGNDVSYKSGAVAGGELAAGQLLREMVNRRK
jgi:hypothetical protein